MTEKSRDRGMKRRAALALAPAAIAAIAAPAVAQGLWPTTTIRFIGIFPPGGGTDILSPPVVRRRWARSPASNSSSRTAPAAPAMSAPRRSPAHRADGNTIGLASVSSLSIAPTLYARLPFDVQRDFTYVSGLWQLPNLLIVNNDVPARTVPELIALLRANPGKYTYASSGSGTTVHLSGEMFKHLAGLDMLHVPYRGGAPAHVDLIGGRVHMIFDNIPQGLAEARAGQVRALAVTGHAAQPDGARNPDHGGIPAGLRDHLLGRRAGPGRRAGADRRSA